MSTTQARPTQVVLQEAIGDYTVRVVRGDALPYVAQAHVTVRGELEAPLIVVSGYHALDVFTRAKARLEQWTGGAFKVDRIQLDLPLTGKPREGGA